MRAVAEGPHPIRTSRSTIDASHPRLNLKLYVTNYPKFHFFLRIASASLFFSLSSISNDNDKKIQIDPVERDQIYDSLLSTYPRSYVFREIVIGKTWRTCSNGIS